MYHGVWIGRLPSATWCLRRARVGAARLGEDARTSSAFPRLQIFPAVGSTRLAPPGSPLSQAASEETIFL